jgi:hypothetical protein
MTLRNSVSSSVIRPSKPLSLKRLDRRWHASPNSSLNRPSCDIASRIDGTDSRCDSQCLTFVREIHLRIWRRCLRSRGAVSCDGRFARWVYSRWVSFRRSGANHGSCETFSRIRSNVLMFGFRVHDSLSAASCFSSTASASGLAGASVNAADSESADPLAICSSNSCLTRSWKGSNT